MSSILIILLLGTYIFVCVGHEAVEHFTNDWVVRLTGGKEVADELARELNYENMGELGGFPDTYIMRKRDHPKRSRRSAGHLTKRFSDDKRVQWAEQQVAMKRSKRGNIYRIFEKKQNEKATFMDRFNDELWPDQWYLHEKRSTANTHKVDLRTIPVWDMGYTGKGVVVTIVDDGLEWNHTDIINNYDPEASYDANDDDGDPFPRYDESDSNNHGTRCAGEVAMTADNEKCGVGVAYNARIGGIRMLDGPVTDLVESLSLSHNIHHIDVFSASWGPNDNGKTVDGPHRLASEALEKGTKEGRKGKGVIYIWAAGNGGAMHDNCNCDGYTNSIYTLSVGSASQHGDFPCYGERCASTMTATYSSGARAANLIATTDLHNACTLQHTGTSAAAPLAAGIVALILEANPGLTWRDMQHMVVWYSDYWVLRHNRGWKQNAAGLIYNSRFGFGLMNAEAMVRAALNWTTVPHKTTCKVLPNSRFPLEISSNGNDEVEVMLSTDGCKGTSHEINFIEHVELTLDAKYNHRGALDMFLYSPADTESMLLSRRAKDSSSTGFKNWTFMSVHFWGEDPLGQWKAVIRDKTGKNYKGLVKSVSLKLHGTKEMPEHMKNGPKYLPDRKLIERTLDRVSEYEEQTPVKSKDVVDKFERIEDPVEKNELDWEDLVGKEVERANSYRNVEDRKRDVYLKLIKNFYDYFENERTSAYDNYYDYK